MLRLVFLLQVFLLGCGHGEPRKPQGIGNEQLGLLIQELRAGRVGTVEVLQIPSNVMTRVQISPERLDVLWDYRWTVRRIDNRRIDKLVALLRDTTIERDIASSDIRRGVLFYSLTGEKRIAALYFDRTGRQGAVNNVPVSFARGFESELQQILSVPSIE